MKISKALGVGLLLHVLLIAALVVQPSCMTMEAPTQTYQQSKTPDPLASSSADGSISTSRTDSLFDSAFNGGFNSDSSGRFTPTRPDAEFSEFERVTPRLSPILSNSASSTVEVAGPSFKIHLVQKGDSLWAISKRYSVSLDELYAANGLNKNSVLKIGQQIKIPGEGGTATINTITADTYQPSGFNMAAETYMVAKGDTLSKIARMFNTSVSMIKAANSKKSDVIRVGEKLTIPVNGSTSNYSKPSSTRAVTKTSSMASSGGSAVHVVKMGEYPATIARQYGMTTSELLAMNGITDPRKMQVGQKLKVNTKGSASVTEPRFQTAPSIAPKSSAVIQLEKSNMSGAPVAIRVLEADPLIESEIDPDSMFENAEEMPVIPFDE
jgi:LysM repeat protein